MKKPSFVLSLTLVAFAAWAGWTYSMAQISTDIHNDHKKDSSKNSAPIIYYKDPNGKPFYSLALRKTDNGESYNAVYAHEDVRFNDDIAEKQAEKKAIRKVLYYRNPMGLADISKIPKKDSMGMDYIPVYDGDELEEGIIKISPAKIQRTGVRSEAVKTQNLARQIKSPGIIQLDERRIVIVSTRSDAFVEKVADITTGDFVKAGQTLIQLYSPEIAAASAQYVSDLNSSIRSPTTSGSRQRLENLNVSKENITTIETTRKPLISVTWKSPRNGVILERNAIEGSKVTSGEVLFRLADTSLLWVIADIPEIEADSIKRGDPVHVTFRGFPGKGFESTLSLIYPQMSADTRTVRVRIEIPNIDNALLPGMYADVTIMAGRTAKTVAIPDHAVVDTGLRKVAFIDRGEGLFEPRNIKTGLHGNGFYEILDGLAEGDRVVVNATFLIDAESNLKAALNTMIEGDKP